MPDRPDINRYQSLLDNLGARRSPDQQIPLAIQEAIISTESSGRPSVIGDIGAVGGESRGLMQIQDETVRGLYNRNLLPKVWNGKKVKKRDLPELLLDPEFNKQAGAALYEDNKKILAKKAKQKGMKLSDQELEDLAIKSHNQGVTRTIKRDLLQEESLNPKVQQYLEKVKSRQNFQDGGFAGINELGALTDADLNRQILEDKLNREADLAGKPQFQEGGFVEDPDQFNQEPFEPEVPTLQPGPDTTYQDMMAAFDKEKEQYREEKKRASMIDLMSNITRAFGKYGARRGAAKAQIAGGFEIAAPKVDIKATDLVAGLKKPDLKEYLQKTQMMKTLAGLKEKKGPKAKVVAGRIYEKEKGKWVPKTPAPPPRLIRREFQQSDWVDETTGQPLVFSGVTGSLHARDKDGKLIPFKGLARRKIPKILEDKEGRKYRLLQTGKREYIDQSVEGKYSMWKDMTPKQQTYMKTLGKEYRVETRPIDDFESTLKGLGDFVEANLDGTIGAITRQLARTVGQEKGVMTDADVKAFGGTDKVITSIAQYAHAKVHGGMTDEIQNNFNAIIKVAQANIARKRIKIEKKYIRPAKFRLGKQASDAFIHEALGMSQLDKKKEKTGVFSEQRKQVIRDKVKTVKTNWSDDKIEKKLIEKYGSKW